ncbi:hypothetical protein C8R47DRAFT_1243176 [Mycena vitilis]|nr:hypothetical protein C8R47DRAFT_1243176 [Mycena vitilis]
MSTVAGFVGFVVPGTPARAALDRARKPPSTSTTDVIDPTTGFVKTATPPRKGRGSRRRNIEAENAKEFPNAAAMAAATEAFDRLHLKPISIATQISTLAEATLLPDAPPPPLPQVKQFFSFLATKGQSKLGIAGAVGWSLRTTRTFVGRVFAMARLSLSLAFLQVFFSDCRSQLRRAQTATPPKNYREQINAAVQEWSYKEKLLPTATKAKRILRETDLVEFLAACMEGAVGIASNFARLQMQALVSFMYTHGIRPGSIIDANGYQGKGEHLKWGSFWIFHWNKGHRFDESLNVQTSMRNLGRSRVHIDPQLMLEALAITADVFEEDLLKLRAQDPATLTFPIRLKIKATARDLPVFLNTKKTDSLTHAAAAHLLEKIRKFLKWTNFSFISLRYSFASAMIDRLSKTHLRYLMGHARASNLSATTYQVPDRAEDVSGQRFDEHGADFAALALAHSSVAWNRPPPPADDAIKNDPTMKKFVAETAKQLFEEGKQDELILNVLEITAETLEYYMTLSSGATYQGPEPTTSDTAAVEEGLYESLLDAWAATDSTHPFLAVVANDPVNPRLSVLQRHLALIHQDDQKGSRCVWCFTDATLTPEQQNKDHSANYVQHVMACELKHHPNTWRKQGKQSADSDEELEEEECEAIIAAFDEHAEGCFQRLLSFVRGDEVEDDEASERSDEDAPATGSRRAASVAGSDVIMASGRESDVSIRDVSMPGRDSDVSMSSARSGMSFKLTKAKQTINVDVPDSGDGARVLSIAIPVAETGHTNSNTRSHLHAIFFCPICLFDGKLGWRDRLISFPNLNKLMDHLPTHWRKNNSTEINYDKGFECGIPSCPSPATKKTGEMISHLHHEHGYKLIQCTKHCGATSTCDFERCGEDHHDATCFILPAKPIYHNDALLLADSRYPEKLRKPLPDATLVDYRKGDVMKRRYAVLCKAAKVDDFLPTVPPKRRPKKSKAASARRPPPPSPSLPDAASTSADFLLRRCIADVIVLHPEFSEIDTEMLVAANLSVEQLSRLPKSRMPACDRTFSVPEYSKFTKALKKWLEGHELEECVKMLGVEFPGVVNANLAPKLQGEGLSIYDIRDCAAGDLAEYGLDVEEGVWGMMCASIDAWLAARAVVDSVVD